MLHGEAVGLGLIAACRVSAAVCGTRRDLEHEVVAALRASGLPGDLDPYLTDDVLARIQVDKKRIGDNLRFLVIREVGACEPVEHRDHRAENNFASRSGRLIRSAAEEPCNADRRHARDPCLAVLAGLAGLARAAALANGGDESILVLKNVAPTATATGAWSPRPRPRPVPRARRARRLARHAATSSSRSSRAGSPPITGQPSCSARSSCAAPTSTSRSPTHAVQRRRARRSQGQGADPLHERVQRQPGDPTAASPTCSFQLIPPELGAAIMAKPNFTDGPRAGQLQGRRRSRRRRGHQPAVPVPDHGGQRRPRPRRRGCAAAAGELHAADRRPVQRGQDGVIDCCTDPGGRVCPAVGTKM